MKAMILAAGKGTRLRPLTENIPKPMVPLHGKPLLEYTIEWLKDYGFKQIAINLHHQPHVIINHFKNGERWGVDITYSEEKELLGTAGAVKRLSWFFNEPFLVVYGDNLSNCKLNRLIREHKENSASATIALFKREDTSSSGVAEMDTHNRIKRFIEKPKEGQTQSNLVNAGIYFLEPEVIAHIPKDQPYDFGRQLLPDLLMKEQELYGYIMSESEKLYWADTMESYQTMLDAVSDGCIGNVK
ncbi:NTP transferase domain-containing protein [Candidatus Poribacteria bacterium]|nr:NTP transferase domain-containing protein [Candidatus Poribacteria bacterium]